MRFINFFQRDYFSVIYNLSCNYIEQYCLKIKDTKWNHLKWKNLVVMKDPMTLSTYMQILQDIKPKTIIEFGTYEGGTALWMRDMMKSLGLDCVIHTFDIDPKQVKLPQTDNIFFYQFDAFKVDQFFKTNSDLFRSLQHPILVIEDCHSNLIPLLEKIDTFLIKNDYLIVEDTIENVKYNDLALYLQNHNYKVDSYYCDFWGYNNSWNFNSILRKE